LLILLVISIISFLPIINAGNQILSFSVTYGGNHFDAAFSLEWDRVGSGGKLYVVGTSNGFNPSFNKEGIVAMFGENLETPATVKKTPFASLGFSEFFDIAVPIDPDLNEIAVVGRMPDGFGKEDPMVYWLQKTDLTTIDGKQLVLDSGGQNDRATSVGYNNINEVVVGGYSDSVVPRRIAFLVKFFTDKTVDWKLTFEPSGAERSFVNALAVDSENRIIATGSFNYPGKLFDAYVAMFNTYGGLLGLVTFGDSKNEIVFGVTVDDRGFIYVTGTTNSFGANYDIFVAKFDPVLGLKWFKVIDIGNDDFAYSIAVIQHDHIYITGVTFKTDPNGDTFFAKLDAAGNVLYVMKSIMTGEDRGFGVALNIHSTNDIFYVNIAGISNDDPAAYDDPPAFSSTTFTPISPSITTDTPSVTIYIPTISLTSLPALVDVSDSIIPDGGEQRAVVYKFDPPTSLNEAKNSNNNYLSYWLILPIIVSIALITAFIRRRK
jgi:hypothetical protein